MMSVRVCLCLGIVVAMNCDSALGSGVTVGSSTYIDTLDYSDTFTLTEHGGNPERLDDVFPVSSVGLAVENCFGNPAMSWTDGNEDGQFSLVTDDSANSSAADTYPGTSGAGSDTGITETGSTEYNWGFDYGLRDDFVIQFDAVQTQDRVDIVIGGDISDISHSASFCVFVRAADNLDKGVRHPEVGIYNSGIGEFDTGLVSGIATDGDWHNYAVRFNTPSRELEVFVDEQVVGMVDIDTVGGGAFSGFTFSTATVSVGYHGFDRFWTDNFQIGSPVDSLPGDANRDGTVDQNDAAILAANWQTTGGAGWLQGDFNSDGNVDDIDATLLATNWSAATATSVPEPSTLSLLLGGVILLFIRRRRG